MGIAYKLIPLCKLKKGYKMKKILLFILPLLLTVGFSFEKETSSRKSTVEKEPINIEMLNEIDGVWYRKDTNEPYSGKVFSLYESGKKNFEVAYKNGKKDGLWTYWYENGQKKEEKTYKDGETDGLQTEWYENGQKRRQKTNRKGFIHGLWTSWYENGQKQSETTWRWSNINIKTIKKWNEDGSLKE